MLDTIYSQAGGAAWILVCALAFGLGGRGERVGAVLLTLAWLASVLLQDENGVAGVYWPVAAVDLALLVVLAALAWKSERSWPVWAAALQLVLVASHLATLVDLRITARGYVAALNLLSYGVLACLALGAWQAWRSRRRKPRPAG